MCHRKPGRDGCEALLRAGLRRHQGGAKIHLHVKAAAFNMSPYANEDQQWLLWRAPWRARRCHK